MDTFREEVINNLEALKFCDSLFENKNEALKLDDAIELIKRGGKYEAMFNDIGKHKYTNIEMEKCSIKATYFPQTNKTITIEIEGNEEDMSKFTEKLNRIVGQINYGVRTNIEEGD